jgi:uncharacterized membrane protein
MTRSTTRIGIRIGWTVAAVLSTGVAAYAYHYVLPHAFVPPNIARNPMAHPWLFVHAAFAATAMLVGPFQFLRSLRIKHPAVHRWSGRIYVTTCLVGGVAGFLLALDSTAGPVARTGFAALAIAWLAATSMAWSLARKRRYAEHRAWMIRSFALTFAAVTLRIYLPLAAIMGLPFIPAYRGIAWLCWVPNLIAAELYLLAEGQNRWIIRRPTSAESIAARVDPGD